MRVLWKENECNFVQREVGLRSLSETVGNEEYELRFELLEDDEDEEIHVLHPEFLLFVFWRFSIYV